MDDIVGQFRLFRTFIEILFSPSSLAERLRASGESDIGEGFKHYFAALALAIAVTYFNVELHPELAIKPKPEYFAVQIGLHVIIFFLSIALILIFDGKLLFGKLLFVYLFLWSATIVVGAAVHFIKLNYITIAGDMNMVIAEDIFRRLILLYSYIVIFKIALGVTPFTTIVLQLCGMGVAYSLLPMIQAMLAS